MIGTGPIWHPGIPLMGEPVTQLIFISIFFLYKNICIYIKVLKNVKIISCLLILQVLNRQLQTYVVVYFELLECEWVGVCIEIWYGRATPFCAGVLTVRAL